jgi:predicted DNA repair protein MutK
MAAANLLALIDDIATILDDVSILSKVAAKKTAGVLGDDLALNAEQVSGVKADRELPVVWAVAKGSLLNKFILVPAALTISAFLPALITVLLVIGGLYLCYEGFEKVSHKLLHSKAELEAHHAQQLNALTDPAANLVELEKDKIKGAIRTDFILSAEIIVIVLGTVQSETFLNQLIVVSSLALLITIGVYGLVAGIVKLDDAGLYLLRKSISGPFSTAYRFAGRSLLRIAPLLMKSLAVIGTLAMFLVGGGILAHSIPTIDHVIYDVAQWLASGSGEFALTLAPTLLQGMLGIIAGGFVLLGLSIINTLRK